MRVLLVPLITLSLWFTTMAHAQPQQPGSPDNLPRHFPIIQRAWQSLDRCRLDQRREDGCPSALSNSAQCITIVEDGARRREGALAGTPIPDPYEIDTSDEIAAAHRNGLLNDMGACLFIDLAARVALGQLEAAMQTYSRICEFPHALVWDPKGWFWLPIEGARTELRSAGQNPSRCPAELRQGNR